MPDLNNFLAASNYIFQKQTQNPKHKTQNTKHKTQTTHINIPSQFQLLGFKTTFFAASNFIFFKCGQGGTDGSTSTK
jgi:hypothetical protein